jgi:hypothetical protein
VKRPLAILYLVVACVAESGEITIGPDKQTSGNYWGRNVSKKFGEPQLRTLYEKMNSPAVDAEITSLTCGKKLAHHEYSATLWIEEQYRERQVRLQMTPRLYQNDNCLEEAVNFVFQRTVKEIDPGPPIDYGYKDPLTGKPLDTSKNMTAVPEKPECSCTP